MDSSIAFQAVAILILIALSSFFSSAETAMTTVNKIRIQSLAEQGNKRAVILEKIISDSPKMLSTVLIGNNIVNMSVSSLMTTLTIKILGNAYVGIATGILTLLILIFGEITPKKPGNNPCREIVPGLFKNNIRAYDSPYSRCFYCK